MIYINQIAALFVMHIKVWLRTPRHAIITISISMIFLLISDHLFVVWMGKHMAVGINTTDKRIARSVAKEFFKTGLSSVRYNNIKLAEEDLEKGRIIALVSVYTNKKHNVDLIFSGKNPLLDRELAGVMLQVSEKVFDSASEGIKIRLKNNKYSSKSMSVFMAAGTLPFLILMLSAINCGLPWKQDWANGTLQRYLAAPIKRSVLIFGRLSGGIFITYISLIISLFVCKYFMSWQFPENLFGWFAIIFIQVFFAGSLFFAIASVCKHPTLYDDITYMLTLILMFISGVIVPVITMPAWERMIAYMMPTFYAVRSMRAIMTGYCPFIPKDAIIIILWGIAACFVSYLCLKSATINSKS